MKNSDPWLEIILTLYNSVALPDTDVERENLRRLSSEHGNVTVGFLFLASITSGFSVHETTLGIFGEQYNNLQLQTSEPVLALHLT